MALEIKAHAPLETLFTEKGVVHADHLGALPVHGHRVEIADFLVLVRADGVRHRARVLRKLPRSQRSHVLDALDRPGLQVGAELLVAKHRQPLFQRELEPIPAGHAVAGPVVEVFMTDHALDTLVIDVRGGFLAGQHVPGIEDVERLVFHRPHVEVIGRNNVVDVQVVFQAKALLVPLHRVDQRRHGVTATVGILFLDEEPQRNVSTATRGEAVLDAGQVTRHQSEQVGRLGERINPTHPVTAAIEFAGFNGISIRQQHGEAPAFGLQGDVVSRHDVRSIREPGDFAKSLGLALRQQEIARYIQAFQRSVLPRPDLDLRLEQERALPRGHDQALFIALVPGRIQNEAIQRNGHGLQVLAIQLDPVGRCGGRVGLGRERGPNAGDVLANVEMQADIPEQPGIRCVVPA